MNTWTTEGDLKKRVLKLWSKGILLREAWMGGELEWPLQIPLKGPSSSQWSDHFDEARDWIAGLEGLPVVWRDFVHPRLGRNRVPVAVEWPSLDDVLGWLRKKEETRRFTALANSIVDRFPALTAWVKDHPQCVLDEADDLGRLMNVAGWLIEHPRPGIYTRQIDVPGVHSKFLERNRGLLTEWLDLVLVPESIDFSQKGSARFAARFGFLSKPRLVRFRSLDPRRRGPSEMAWRHEDWAAWSDAPRRVFVTENEVNYLAFPPVPDSCVIFGAGYGFEAWDAAAWLQQAEVWYWGDLDTHGFAILDQLRAIVPRARSFLMDEATLLAHREFWGEEDQPADRKLDRLTADEQAVYQGLISGLWAPRLRLEQEHVGFGYVREGLARIG